jgi:hypothetical protein
MAVNSAGPDFTLTRDEVVDLIETTAQAERHMSGTQLLHAFRQGQLENPGEVGEALVLADLLPDDDPMLSGAGEG